MLVMITLKLCYERRNESAALDKCSTRINSFNIVDAAVLFIQDGGFCVKIKMEGGASYVVIQYPYELSACSLCETGCRDSICESEHRLYVNSI